MATKKLPGEWVKVGQADVIITSLGASLFPIPSDPEAVRKYGARKRRYFSA
jgi:hypothetical protein